MYKWLVTFFCVLFLPSTAVYAATLVLEAPGSVTTKQETIAVDVYLNGQGTLINAVEGKILYPAYFLEATHFDYTNSSIFDFWLQRPWYDNKAGTIIFSGLKFGDGYNGGRGKMFTVYFRPVRAGLASLSTSDLQFFIGNGKATPAMSVPASAEILVTALSEATSPVVTPIDSTAPVAPPVISYTPVITSATHPDSNKWYRTNQPAFAWVFPPGVTQTAFSLDRYAKTIPTKQRGLITKWQSPKLTEGKNYFHLRYRVKNQWMSSAHFLVQVDTRPPAAFRVWVLARTNKEPLHSAKVHFKTTDAHAGVDYYWLEFAGQKIKLAPTEISSKKPYTVVFDKAGTYEVRATAVDRAGNSVLIKQKVTVK